MNTLTFQPSVEIQESSLPDCLALDFSTFPGKLVIAIRLRRLYIIERLSKFLE